MRSFLTAGLISLAGIATAAPLLQAETNYDFRFNLIPELNDDLRLILIKNNPATAPSLTFSSSYIMLIDPDSGSSHQPDAKATFGISQCNNQLLFTSKPNQIAGFGNHYWTGAQDLKYGDKKECNSKQDDGGFELIKDSEGGRWLGLRGVGYEDAWAACYDPAKYFPGNDGRWFIRWIGPQKTGKDTMPDKQCVARFSLRANLLY